jgi:hypothetical protein
MLGAAWRVQPPRHWRQGLSAALLTAAIPVLVAVAQVWPGAPVPVALAQRGSRASLACPALDPATAGLAAGRMPAGTSSVSLVDELDAAGSLTGHRLHLVTPGGLSEEIDLPVESAVAAPLGSLLVYAEAPADGPSEVHGLDVESGCDTRLTTAPQVVRSAVIDPAGNALYVHSVSRITRHDLGVARLDLASGRMDQAVPPLPASAEFGPTFGTELRWSAGAELLLVQSCGFSSCRSRVLDIASGRLATYDRPGQGEFIGLTKRHLLTYADCAGVPCPVISTDLDTGIVSTLADEVEDADLGRDRAGRDVLRIERNGQTEEIVQ